MTDAPAQPSADPKPADPNGGGNQPDPKPAAPATDNGPDLAKLSADQLTKVLENPELFKLPRIKELMDNSSEFKKLKKANDDAEAARLKEQGKFEELSTKQAKENETLKGQLNTYAVNQALTGKLVAAGVVDLDGALKLVDRSKIEVGEDGSVTGADEAFEALKTDKAYLFTGTTPPAPVGSPTNPSNGNQPAGPSKFKSSQITPEFYKANEKEILDAYSKGLVEDDGPPPQ